MPGLVFYRTQPTILERVADDFDIHLLWTIQGQISRKVDLY